MPDNFTTNFTARKIYVTFDEFVQLKDQQKEFFTSPQMKKKPQLSIRGRGILIQIKDTLKENTTYALNFGSAVRDNNEGNPLYSMRYVFSTGPEVDSMVVSGIYGRQLHGRQRSQKVSFASFRPIRWRMFPNTTRRCSNTSLR